MMANDAKPQFLSIPLTPEEIKIVNAYRSLHPRSTMKVSKNDDGSRITISVESHEVVRVEHNLPPAYGTMNP